MTASRFAARCRAGAALLLVLCGCWSKAGADAPSAELSLVVMDPLAAPLSCPCVQGYAQRDYQQLADHLQRETGRAVRVTFAESLTAALAGNAGGRADLIIGKDSVVRHDARKAKLALAGAARLTGKDGSTTQTGLIVVPSGDPAERVGQLQGYRIFFGPEDSREKHQAALELLRQEGVTVAGKLDTSAACSDGACQVLELYPKVRAAAVISSYAKPLLEGCGTIDRGALRVVGETAPVPFITAFVSADLPESERTKLTGALLAVATDPALCQSLESLLGFLPVAAPESGAKKN